MWRRFLSGCVLVTLVILINSPVQAQGGPSFARFAGTWIGRPYTVLTVQTDGYAELEWRVYGSWCYEDGASQPCDTLNGPNGEMVPGGHAVIRFTSVSGDTLSGSMRASTEPSDMDPFNTPPTLTLMPDEVAIFNFARRHNQTLCTQRYVLNGNNGVWDKEC